MSVSISGKTYNANGNTFNNTSKVINANTLKIATFGDSKSNLNSANFDMRFIDVNFNGGTQSFQRYSCKKSNVEKYYPNCWVMGNGGVSGETVQAMVARGGAAATTTRKSMDDIISLSPDVVIIKGGSINNLMAVTDATLANVVAKDMQYHAYILNYFLNNSNAIILDWGTEGFRVGVNGAVSESATQKAVVLLNNMIKAFCSKNTRTVYMDPTVNIDGFGVIGNVDGTWYSELMSPLVDGTHNGVVAAHLASMQEAKAIATIFGDSKKYRFSGVNLLSNPSLLLPYSGNVFGPTPAGWSAVGNNATLTNAQVDMTGDSLTYGVDVTPIVSGAGNAYVTIPFKPSSYAIASGDYVGFECDVDIVGYNNVLDLKKVNLRIDIRQVVGGGRIVLDDYMVEANETNGIFTQFGNRLAGKMQCGPLRINDSSSNLNDATSQLSFTMDLNGLNPVRLRLSNARFVKLSAPYY